MQKFTDEKIEILIELVRLRPGLYDKNSDAYKKMMWKDEQWEDISNELDMDAKDCKRAWRALRDQYKKCIRNLGKPGQELDPYKRRYKHFERLSFLADFCDSIYEQSCDPWSYSDLQPEKEVSQEGYWSEMEIPFPEETQDVPNDDCQSVDYKCVEDFEEDASGYSSPLPAKRVKIADSSQSHDDHLKTLFLRKLISANTSARSTDGTDRFFLGLAATVKSYNLAPHELAKLQCKIMKFVVEELEKIRMSK